MDTADGVARVRPIRCRWRSADARAVDRGSGTIWVVALVGAVWAVATMAMAVGGARIARHRAQAAADLAALAAAAHAAEGSERACGLATRVAHESEARLRRCAVHGRVADVLVTSRVGALPRSGWSTATARARAGPVDEGPPPAPGLPAPGVTGDAAAR
jgi:secretion/DNA translocation related TadE-like protein